MRSHLSSVRRLLGRVSSAGRLERLEDLARCPGDAQTAGKAYRSSVGRPAGELRRVVHSLVVPPVSTGMYGMSARSSAWMVSNCGCRAAVSSGSVARRALSSAASTVRVGEAGDSCCRRPRRPWRRVRRGRRSSCRGSTGRTPGPGRASRSPAGTCPLPFLSVHSFQDDCAALQLDAGGLELLSHRVDRGDVVGPAGDDLDRQRQPLAVLGVDAVGALGLAGGLEEFVGLRRRPALVGAIGSATAAEIEVVLRWGSARRSARSRWRCPGTPAR